MAERIRPPRPAPTIYAPTSKFPGLLVSNLVLSEVKLGKGSDATVFAAEWNGTLCAAKRLHDILLEDESPGGADKFISNFEEECLTWSKLRHPGVVQFLGVHMDRRSRLPVLVMEKMDTSLRTYLEDHNKEQFPLHQKAFVLRQVTQALAYLHSQNPPLVHHDLSPNNVLLNAFSFVTKISDFGMSRAINPSALTRKSSIKGTLAFMAPEALHDPPQYNEKLDVFSFGNIVISTLTHEWPNPGPPNQYRWYKLVGLSELQRREHYVVKFTAQEKQLFLPVVRQCLENRPEKRPSSVMLVQELRRIESTFPSDDHVDAPIAHLRQQLAAKEQECKEKDEAMKEKDEALKKKDEAVKEKDVAMRAMQADIQQLRSQNSVLHQQLGARNAEGRQQSEEVVREKSATIRAQQAEIQRLKDQLAVSLKVSQHTSLNLLYFRLCTPAPHLLMVSTVTMSYSLMPVLSSCSVSGLSSTMCHVCILPCSTM